MNKDHEDGWVSYGKRVDTWDELLEELNQFRIEAGAVRDPKYFRIEGYRGSHLTCIDFKTHHPAEESLEDMEAEMDRLAG